MANDVPSFPSWRTTCVLILLGWSVHWARSAEVLTNFAQIRLLPPGAARVGRAFSCDAVVTYYNTNWPICFLQDPTSGTFVHMDFRVWKLHVGQRVRATGEVHTDGLPKALHFVVLESAAPLPEAHVAPLSEYARGVDDSHRIKATGWLTDRWLQNGHYVLELVGEFGQKFRGALPLELASAETLDAWMGGRLDIQGVCGLEFSPAHEHIGFRVWIPGTNHIDARPLGPVSSNPGSSRPVSSVDLQNFDRDHPRPFQVSGVVTLQKSERSFYIEDGSGGVLVSTVEPISVKPGQKVTVLGAAAEGAFSPFLRYARVRLDSDSERSPLPVEQVQAPELLFGYHEAHRVAVEGRVLSGYQETDRHAWILESGQMIFTAAISTNESAGMPSPVRGSVIRVTGVCELKVDQDRKPRTFQILAASPADFVVTRALPWWTVGRMLTATGVTLGCALLAFIWGATLRRRVATQTQKIGEQLEIIQASEQRHRSITEGMTEGLLLLDPQFLIRDANPQMLRLTGYSRDELIGRSVIETFVAPEDRDRVVRERGMRARTEPIQFEQIIRRRDGSQFWALIAAAPLRGANGERIGIVASHFDITDRRRTEDDLKRSLAEKETLLREVHHRVKNNLQVISSLLYFQEKKVPVPELAAEFQQSRDRLAAIALVHERLYESGDLARIDFATYLRGLGRQILEGAGRSSTIQLEVSGGSFAVGVAGAIPCALILNELITNSLKHAFPEGRAGSIRIHLSCGADNRCQIEISDNGVGLPAGAEAGSSASLGLRLVHRLVDQIQGTIVRVPSAVGTLFCLSFPKPA